VGNVERPHQEDSEGDSQQSDDRFLKNLERKNNLKRNLDLEKMTRRQRMAFQA